MSKKVIRIAKWRNQEEHLDRLRAHHLGWTYTRFKERQAELRAQIPLMTEKKANEKHPATQH